MKTNVREAVLKDIEKFPDDDVRKITDAIYIIKELSSLSESTHLKKLKGEENGFRYKVGSYRIILRWDKKTQILTIEGVKKRKDIYKKK